MYGLLSNTLDSLLALQQGVDYAKDRDYFGMDTSVNGGIFQPTSISTP